MSLTDQIKEKARLLGFDLCRVTPVAAPRHAGAYSSWLAQGMQGEMGYLAERKALRADPRALAPGAASIIMLAANYNPGPPPEEWKDPARGRIARYAWSPDYHDFIKRRLYDLDAFIRERTGRTTLAKACVDTAPFLERDFAMEAGLGFTGKNTVLITPGLGSWTFLAALLVPEALEYDPSPWEGMEEWRSEGAEDSLASTPSLLHPSTPLQWQVTGAGGNPRTGTCGSCTRCLGACPTRAFAGPYVLDARRCISYLTIELKGPIPRELRPAMGNWVFGCDVCQEICPYNRDGAAAAGAAADAAGVAAWPGLEADPDRAAPALLDLLALDEAGFRARFRGTAVLRARRRGLVRNACVAAGNWGDPAAVPVLAALLRDPEPLVRGHAAWALGRIGVVQARQALAAAAANETDPYVQEELSRARSM